MQLGVFLIHGLPNSSEKFYDLSGSFTHLALVLTCLLAEYEIQHHLRPFPFQAL